MIGDYATSPLNTMSETTYTDAGNEMVMTVQTPPVHVWPNRLTFNAVHVDVLPGVGLNTVTPADLDPVVMLDWSDDGGAHWSVQRQLPVGRQGARMKRVKTTRLGMSREDGRVFRLSMSAAVARGVAGMAADVDMAGG